MDENQFRAEIAEIFREQDRRFERAQKRMDKFEAANKERFDQIEKLQKENTKAISSLQKVVSDLIDVYQVRDQISDQKIENLNTRVQALEKGL